MICSSTVWLLPSTVYKFVTTVMLTTVVKLGIPFLQASPGLNIQLDCHCRLVTQPAFLPVFLLLGGIVFPTICRSGPHSFQHLTPTALQLPQPQNRPPCDAVAVLPGASGDWSNHPSPVPLKHRFNAVKFWAVTLELRF